MQCCKASYTSSTPLSVPVWSKTMHLHTQNPVQQFSGFSVYPQPRCRYYWLWSQMPSRKPHKPTMWLWDRSHGDVPMWTEPNDGDHKCPLMSSSLLLITYWRSCDLSTFVSVWLALTFLQLMLCCSCKSVCISHSFFFPFFKVNPLIGKQRTVSLTFCPGLPISPCNTEEGRRE